MSPNIELEQGLCLRSSARVCVRSASQNAHLQHAKAELDQLGNTRELYDGAWRQIAYADAGPTHLNKYTDVLVALCRAVSVLH